MNVKPLIRKNVDRFFNLTRLSPDHVWGLGDQALVSAANFLTLFLVARYSSVTDVGYYALSISVVIILIGVQDSIVTRPYTIRFFKPGVRPEEHAFSALMMSLIYGAACSLVLGAATLALNLAGYGKQIGPTFGVLALTLTFFLLREFIRRFSLANMETRHNFFFDASCILTLFIAFLALIHFDQLNSVNAIAVMGLSYGVNALIAIYLKRSAFAAGKTAFWKTVTESWDLGRWMLPGRVAMEIQGYFTHWASAIMLSAAATGAFAACLSVVALSNPFLIGMLNIMNPKIVRAIKDGGMAGLRRQLLIDCVLIGSVMFGFGAVLFFFGGQIMTLLFPAESYSGYGNILAVLGISIFITSLGGIATVSLTSLELGKVDSTIAMVICGFYLFTIPVFISLWGLLGASFALLIGETLAAVARWATLHVVMNQDRFEEMPQSVRRIWTGSIEEYRRRSHA